MAGTRLARRRRFSASAAAPQHRQRSPRPPPPPPLSRLPALGLPPAIWLGARRDGHAGLAALAYPATGVLLLTILMAYSRGALLAAGVGIGLWLIVAPLRLRSAAETAAFHSKNG